MRAHARWLVAKPLEPVRQLAMRYGAGTGLFGAGKPQQKGEGLELVRKLVQGVGGSVSSEYATDGITHLPIKDARSAKQLTS
jgi:hypothetical protein